MREFLNGLGLEADIVEKIETKHNELINPIKNDLEKHKSESEGYKTQLEEANTQIESFKGMDIDSIKKSAEEYKTKYEESEKQREADKYRNSAEKYLDKYQFSSKLVKDAVLDKFIGQEFKLDGDNFLGADDFISKLKEEDPGAFKLECDDNKPTIIVPGGKDPKPGKKLSSIELMKMKNENPNLDLSKYL